MSRSDESLRRIAVERLHAVARPGAALAGPPPGAAPHDARPVPWEPQDDDRTDAGTDAGDPDPHPAWLPRVDAPPADDPDDGDPGGRNRSGSSAPSRGRHRRTPPPADDVARGAAHASDAAPEPAGLPLAAPAEPPRVPSWPPVGTVAPGDVRDVAAVATAAPDDVRDVVERMRREALAEAASRYSDRHGHPLDHPSMDARPARRWFLTVRHAVVAGVAVALLTAGIVVRATAGVPEPAEPLGGAASPVVAGPDAASAPGSAPPGSPADADAETSGAPPAAGGDAAATAGSGTPGAVTPDAAGASAGALVVHVVGQVGAPGVVRLPAGSRVQDALQAAGGASPTADLSAVNLARPVVDGEQIVVPAPGEAAAPAPPSAPVAGDAQRGGPSALVDLNAADGAALDALPGIGPVLVQRILDWRTENGPFRAVDELGEVTGIGDALLGRLRPLVTV